ncbi:hypothetical protein [Kribbella swartbergensis]
MVGRFKVRPGDGANDWSVWDNAMNGCRGAGLTREEAHAQAADLELQYDAHGARSADNVRRVSPAVAVEAWRPAGVLDAWVRENGCWVGRVRLPDGGFAWIEQARLRPAGDS